MTAEAVGVVTCLGRIYALTMLYNLNYRSSLRHGPANVISTHSLETGNTMNGIRECLPSILELLAQSRCPIVIHLSDVHHTATVHYESPVRLQIVLPILSPFQA